MAESAFSSMPSASAWSLVTATDEFARLQSPIFRPDKARRVLELLLAEEVASPAQVVEARPISQAQLERVHTASYLARLRRYAQTVPAYAVAELEIPLEAATLRAAEHACGATCLAAQLALDNGRGAVHLGGGFHHAFAGHGEGFCLFNDVAVALNTLLDAGRLNRALVVDLDAHQGNGTARLFRGEPRVYTMSLHNAAIYPHPKETSDLDVPLPPGTGDETYLAALDEALTQALRESGLDGDGDGDAPAKGHSLLVLLAGVDPYEDDRLGGLALTKAGLRKRTAAVLQAARSRNLPALILLAGGYPREATHLYDLHADTVREAAETWRP